MLTWVVSIQEYCLRAALFCARDSLMTAVLACLSAAASGACADARVPNRTTAPMTSPLRTAVDVRCFMGCVSCRRCLDAAAWVQSPCRTQEMERAHVYRVVGRE